MKRNTMKSKIRSVMALLIAMMMVFSSFPQMVTAEAAESASAVKLSVVCDPAEADPGEQVTVKVNIAGNPGIMGATLTLTYADELDLISAENGEAFSALVMTKPGQFKSGCNFLWDSQDLAPTDIKDGTILTLTFAILGSAARDTDLDLNVEFEDPVDTNLEVVDVQVEQTKVHVKKGQEDPIVTCEHEYETEVVEPTCTQQGYTIYTCKKCGESYKADYVDKKGHTIVTDMAVEPTCTAKGYTEGSHCSVCGEVLAEQEEIPAKGHTWTEWETLEDGSRKRTCTVCGTVETREKETLATPEMDFVVFFMDPEDSFIGVSFGEVEGASTYRLYRKADGDDWELVADNLDYPLYNDRDFVIGKTYTYTAQAVGESGESLFDSTGKSVETGFPSPLLYEVKNVAGGINVDWIEDISGYELFRSEDGGEYEKITTINDQEVSEYLDTDVKEGSEYKYKVRLYAKVGETIQTGIWSNIETITKEHVHTVVKLPAKAATVFKTGLTAGTKCSVCGKIIKAQKVVPKLKPTIKLSVKKKTIKKKKSFTLTVSGLAKGDSIKSVKTSKKTVATVKKTAKNKYKITGKKKGKATITVILKSGKKATCTVTVK